jgi:hypothetical protein
MNELHNLFGAVGLGQSVHHGVVCDGCDVTPIKGLRFKCSTCPNYDLCQTCKDKALHPEHQFQSLQTTLFAPFGPQGWPGWAKGTGGRCGRGGKKQGADGASEDDKELFTQEDKQNMKQVIQTVTEAAKTSAFEIAGAAAGDCAAQTVAVSVRSSIRRAMILEKTTGVGKRRRQAQDCKDSEETRVEEDSSTSDSESDDEENDVAANKQIKKKAKTAAKKIAKLTRKEVTAKFGKVAGKWAAVSARQSMIQSICQGHRASQRDLAKEERKTAKKAAGETQPEPTDAGDTENLYPTLTPSAPEVETFEIPSEEELAVNNAIQVFCDMGYKPDDWLVSHIREAKGSIPAVFEQLKSSGQ